MDINQKVILNTNQLQPHKYQELWTKASSKSKCKCNIHGGITPQYTTIFILYIISYLYTVYLYLAYFH